MGTKKAVAAGAALAAAGFIGAGIAQAAPLDAFVLGGPRVVTADVIGAGSYSWCGVWVNNARTTGAPTAGLENDWAWTSGRNNFRLRTTPTKGVKYVDVACYPTGNYSNPKIVKKNFVVNVF